MQRGRSLESNRRRLTSGLVFIVLLAIAGACGGGSSESTDKVNEVEVDEVEGDEVEVEGDEPLEVTEAVAVGDSTVMDIYRPPNGADLPMLVLLHGTGEGGRAEMGPLARAIAERGVVVFVPSWEVIHDRPDRQTFDADIYRVQTEAVVCSLRHARRTATEYGGSPDRLGLMGHSGGGLVGVRAALVDDPPPWSGMDCDQGVDHRPDVFIGSAGDYSGRFQFTSAAGDDYAPFDPEQLLGGNLGLVVELIHGFRDGNVDPFVSHLLYEQLLVAGYDARFTALDTRHGALIRPNEPAGQLVVDRVLALLDPVDGGTSEPTAELAFDGSTCSYSGPDILDPGESLPIRLINTSDAPAYLFFYNVEGIELEDALANSPGVFMEEVPYYVDTGSGWMVPARSERAVTWAFVDRPYQWILSCIDDLQPFGSSYHLARSGSLIYQGAGLAPSNLR